MFITEHPVAASCLAIFLLCYGKALPFVWHIRYVGTGLLEAMFPVRLTAVTDRVVWRDRVTPEGMDLNLHQNNATYSSMADFARLLWVARVWRASWTNVRTLRPFNGGVAHLFLRELQFWEPVNVSVELVGVDSKWFFLRLEHSSRRTGRLHAIGITRFVVKEANGKTVPPREVMTRLGWDVPVALATDTQYGELVSRLSDALLTGVNATVPEASKQRVGSNT